MTRIFCAIFLLACSRAAQAADPPKAANYSAVMAAQYAAHAPVTAQRPEEAQRVYDIYLKSIGQKSETSSDSSTVDGEVQPH